VPPYLLAKVMFQIQKNDSCLSRFEVSPAVGDYVSNTAKDKTLGIVAINRSYVADDDSGNSLKLETMIGFPTLLYLYYSGYQRLLGFIDRPYHFYVDDCLNKR